MTTLLIDNYDSFTYNVYQYLSDLGANVIVYRNDEITVEECVALQPRNVVISPGPGKPADSGISPAVIRAFEGKVPILGVCLGEQAMFEVYGGTVTYAGEIVHGKTSPIVHDSRGLFAHVPQHIEVTRYHSLVADPATVPACLEVTSRTVPSGRIMGVRHRTYVMEGVQFHPESIASEHGKRLFANFLSWEGGTWDKLVIRKDLVREIRPEELHGARGVKSTKDAGGADNQSATVEGISNAGKSGSILETITARRANDVELAAQVPGLSFQHLMQSYALGLAPSCIDMYERILSCAHPVAVLAEMKRASPSKGPIDAYAHAATQALEYAHAGAAAVSVLTEPHWFRGSLDDLRDVRRAFDADDTLAHLGARPAVLRKEFVVVEYQILEARLAGADSVLLIVAVLLPQQLARLMRFARTLGMEPLVEVANAEEMRIALEAGASLVGVNNRDLHTFKVDRSRTVELADMLVSSASTGASSRDGNRPPILIALSGIKGPDDVQTYVRAGAKGVLVGEALMRAPDKAAFIERLSLREKSRVGEAEAEGSAAQRETSLEEGKPHLPLVKICGVTSFEDVRHAWESGADLIGFIFARASPRYVTPSDAREIVFGMRALSKEPVKHGHAVAPRAILTRRMRALTVQLMALEDDSAKEAGEGGRGALSKIKASDSVSPLSVAVAAAGWWYGTCARILVEECARRRKRGLPPLFVGVFVDDTSVAGINDVVDEVGLDLVQFHGTQPPHWASLVAVPVVQVVHVEVEKGVTAGEDNYMEKSRAGAAHRALDTISKGVGHVALCLLDTAVKMPVVSRVRGEGGSENVQRGGSGQVFDWAVANDVTQGMRAPFGLPVEFGGGSSTGAGIDTVVTGTGETDTGTRFALTEPELLGGLVGVAGGLTPENVGEAVHMTCPVLVDVSSGVEREKGRKDHGKVAAFCRAATAGDKGK